MAKRKLRKTWNLNLENKESREKFENALMDAFSKRIRKDLDLEGKGIRGDMVDSEKEKLREEITKIIGDFSK